MYTYTQESLQALMGAKVTDDQHPNFQERQCEWGWESFFRQEFGCLFNNRHSNYWQQNFVQPDT